MNNCSSPSVLEAEPQVEDGLRRLTPCNARLYMGQHSVLHCEIDRDALYRGVFPVLMFPIRHPDRFISVCYTDEADDKEKEIGIIEDADVFPADQQELIRKSLDRQYHEQVIQRILKIRYEYGLLFFEVETQRGRESFAMPWRNDRAEEHGENGKVLLDAFDNRYVIPDVQALPTADQHRFTSYVYW